MNLRLEEELEEKDVIPANLYEDIHVVIQRPQRTRYSQKD